MMNSEDIDIEHRESGWYFVRHQTLITVINLQCHATKNIKLGVKLPFHIYIFKGFPFKCIIIEAENWDNIHHTLYTMFWLAVSPREVQLNSFSV